MNPFANSTFTPRGRDLPAGSPRAFEAAALAPYATAEIRPAVGRPGAQAWRYSVLVPVEEVAGTDRRPVASAEDLRALGLRLAADFGGVTGPFTPVLGIGIRSAQDPVQSQQVHACFVVYTAAVAAADRYFQALRRELERALGQAVVLIERQEVLLV
jgi:hypothetical protein